MKSNYILLISIFLFAASCKTHQNIDLSVDTQKSIELINQVIIDNKSDYSASNCVYEKYDTYTILANFDEKVKNSIGIKNEKHYQAQKVLYEDFIITNKIITNKYILTKEKKQELRINGIYGDTFIDWLIKNHGNKFYFSISKPIFNETYDKAFVKIEKKPNALFSISGKEEIYYLENGVWTLKHTITMW